MKPYSLVPSVACASLLALAAFTATAIAQAPQNPAGTMQAPGMNGPAQEGGAAHPGMPQEHNFPPPKNLKVLPKHLTGAQVRDIMHHWAGDLGVGCDKCHAEYPDHRLGPNGHPELDFPSDVKPDKRMARVMYKMMELDKKDYIAKVSAMDTTKPTPPPLTCGTCHRGHVDPEAYVPPKHEGHGAHPEGGAPAGGPPAPQGY